jgi:dipeptidyl aminopeptidase/acylaminoacyl peptidase
MEREVKRTIQGVVPSLIFMLFCTLSVKAITPKEVFDYRSIGDVKVSPDGKRAVFSLSVTDLGNNTFNSNLWLIDLEAGKYFQLTQGEKMQRSPAWSPDGKKIAFLSNRGGPNQIWMISPDGGEAEPAANFGRINVLRFRWLPQGDGFIFMAVRPQQPEASAPQPTQSMGRRQESRPIIVDKSITHYDLKPRMKARLLKIRFGDEKPEMLIKEDRHILSFDISPDGKTVAFSSQPASGRLYEGQADLSILELETGAIRDLITLPGSDMNPQFSPDGKKIAFIHNEGDLANRTLHIVGIDGSGHREAVPSYDENIMDYDWSLDNKSIFFLGSRGVSSVVFRVDVSNGQYEAVKALDGLHVCEGYSFSRDGKIGAAVISDPSSPEEIFVIKDSGQSKRKLSRINQKFEGTAPKTEILKYKSKDDLDLEGLVIKPKDFEEGKRYPLLVIVHGGPANVFTYGFNPGRGAYPLFSFVEQGYVIFLPNPRGSTGYGEKFRKANFRDLGGKDFGDIMTGVDLLIEKGIADADRMGLMGWSYGGFMAYWTVTHTDRFKAISAGAGLTNLISFYGTNDAEGAGLETYFDSAPWEDPQLLLDHSALRFIKNAKTPLLIQHGDNDLRVPLAQAQEFYFAAIKVGLPVEMVVYPGQGHSLREPQLALAAMEKNLEWFNKWLLGIEPPKDKKQAAP